MTTSPAFTIDRRPRIWFSNVNASGASIDPRHLGRDYTFLTTGMTAVMAKVKAALSLGFSHPVLANLPGYPGTGPYTSAFWPLLDSSTQKYLSNLPTWLTQLDIYSGYQINSPYTFDMTGSRTPDLSLDADAKFWACTWNPLIRALSAQGKTFNTLWLDTAGAINLVSSLVTLAAQVNSPRLGGEPLPIYDAGAGAGPGGRVYNISLPDITRRPFVMTRALYEAFSPSAPIPWAVSPSTTEVRIFDELGTYTLSEVQAIAAKGFIVDAFVDGSTSYLQNILTAQGY